MAQERLALLLSGAGVKCRRCLTEDGLAQSPLDALAAERGFHGLVKRARQQLGDAVGRALETADRAGFSWVTPDQDGFPSRLRQTSDPPLGLFIRGRWPEQPAAAIIGSRRPTRYGIDVTAAISEEVAHSGVVVVSGMARGIDGAAHQAALEAGGRTVAVWGTGPGRIYPAEHSGLAESIASSGALISEFPPGSPPKRHHFPQRNRLIAGLSHVIVVVEAAARSGALLTARLGLDENRDILAVPGSIFSELSVGPNALLRAGARPVLSPKDILDAIGVDSREGAKATMTSEADDLVLGIMGPGEAFDVDELASRTGRPIEELLVLLLELELAGVVERQGDGRYARRRGDRG